MVSHICYVGVVQNIFLWAYIDLNLSGRHAKDKGYPSHMGS